MSVFESGKVYAGRYTLKTLIGSGGMGEVWKAEQSGIGREVAIKFLHPELMRHPTAKKRVLSKPKPSAAFDTATSSKSSISLRLNPPLA